MQPRTRSDRHSLATKDCVEKERLRHRTGAYFRYEDLRNPIDHAQGCPGHAGTRERMLSGHHAEEVNHYERETKKYHRDEVTETRRAQNYQREEKRWNSVNAMELAAQERTRRMMADPMMGRKNVQGQPYNIVSQAYDNTPAGAQLEHHDNMIKYRSKVRQATLAMQNHLGYNPIIGQMTHEISLPPKPRPSALAMGGASCVGTP